MNVHPTFGERRFGLSFDEWSAAAGALVDLLDAAAVRRQTVTYGQAARVAFGGRFSARSSALMALLAEVDEAALRERGVMVAALVVRADTGRPGEGFYRFAEAMENQQITDREEYWRAQAQRVWNAYDEERRIR
ncbi:MAG: hypothetical protein U1E26_09440 [Coriobacteriia bacterium]|nr:hypothetical protein [Coriobacteriia bacterium]